MVGGRKADAGNIFGQPIRVFPDHMDRCLSVLLKNPGSVSGANPLGLKKNHHIPDFLLVIPGAFDHIDPFGTNTFHLGQPLGMTGNNIQGLLAKLVNDSFGHFRADPFDKP